MYEYSCIIVVLTFDFCHFCESRTEKQSTGELPELQNCRGGQYFTLWSVKECVGKEVKWSVRRSCEVVCQCQCLMSQCLNFSFTFRFFIFHFSILLFVCAGELWLNEWVWVWVSEWMNDGRNEHSNELQNSSTRNSNLHQPHSLTHSPTHSLPRTHCPTHLLTFLKIAFSISSIPWRTLYTLLLARAPNLLTIYNLLFHSIENFNVQYTNSRTDKLKNKMYI